MGGVAAGPLLMGCRPTRAWLGDADAQYQMGLASKAKHPEAARQWFDKAAAKGNPPAQYELGLASKAKNPETALAWFTKASGKGHAPAHYELGLAYRRGLGVAKNRVTAVRLFERACAAGVKAACPEAKLKLLVRQTHSIDIALDGAMFLDGMVDNEKRHFVDELGQGYQTTVEKAVLWKQEAVPADAFKESPNLFDFVIDLNTHFSEHTKYFFFEAVGFGVVEHWRVRDMNTPAASTEHSLRYELQGSSNSSIDHLKDDGAAAYLSTVKPKRAAVIAHVRQQLAAWSTRP